MAARYTHHHAVLGDENAIGGAGVDRQRPSLSSPAALKAAKATLDPEGWSIREC